MNKKSFSLNDQLKFRRENNVVGPALADLVAQIGATRDLEAAPEIEKLLDDDSELVRYNAMGVLAFDFGACSRMGRLHEILRFDRDELCRGRAASALGSLRRNSNDAELMGLFASIASDDSEQEHVRISSYKALLNVMGVPRSQQPDPF